MNIPNPPLYNRRARPGSDADGADGSNDQGGGAYNGYYGYAGQNSGEATAHFNGDMPPQRQQQQDQKQHQSSQKQTLGQEYYDYYRTSHGGEAEDENLPADTHVSDDMQQAVPQSIPQAKEQYEYSYYGNNSYVDQQYPANQAAQQAEEKYNDTSHDQSLYPEESFQEDLYEEDQAPPSSTLKEGLLPSIFALAQQLMPTVLKRLNQHESIRIDYSDYQDDDDDFAGRISPLVSPTPPRKATLKYQAYNFTTPEAKQNTNLKTTGLDESEYKNNTSYSNHDDCDENEGGAATIDDPEMGTPMSTNVEDYLPQSAALLVSALQGSARNINRYNDENINTKLSYDNLPSLLNEIASPTRVKAAAQDESKEGRAARAVGGGIAKSQPIKRPDNLEKEAEALMESIRKDELDGSERRRKRRSLQRSRRGDHDSSQDGGVAIGGRTSIFEEDDGSVGDGSIGGDMRQLTRSISMIQRDLENVDFSHLDDVFHDGFGGVGSLGEYDGENGMLSRLKLWFSRGMIMEQKLLNTYVNPTETDGDHDGTTAENSSGRYADNPVLVWSLALMWSFMVLIMMHPKISELVEGGDPGQLADIVEWLFG